LKEQVNAGQCPEPDYIFVTAGTGGTMAGIEMGVRILGMNSRVVGVRITDWLSVNESLIANIVNRGYKLLKDSGARLPPLHLKGSDITMIHEFFGGEYAKITPECAEAKQLARDLENIILDTTYTAKTMAAMISFIKDHGLKDKNILFWHTYNSRDLAPFLDPECTPAKLPGEFHPYFQV
jgi:D-cysteine desulfhydrase